MRLYGGINPTSGKKQDPTIPKKYHYLIDAPFKISEKCCNIMKKAPFYKYNKKDEGKTSYIGTMISDSHNRKLLYIRQGCNAFDNKNPLSSPLSFWTEQDILLYLKKYSLNYSSIYGEIKETNNRLILTGIDRTGCMFCMFGVHLEKYPNRFQRMKQTHPKHWKYCINRLGIGQVLDYIDIPYN